MTPERAREIADRIREAPREIRLLCPRGHFIAIIGLWVPDETSFIWMLPRGPSKRYDGNLDHGGSRVVLNQPTRSFNVALQCTNTRCGYSGSFAMYRLSHHLADAALAGHTEYRLTS